MCAVGFMHIFTAVDYHW